MSYKKTLCLLLFAISSACNENPNPTPESPDLNSGKIRQITCFRSDKSGDTTFGLELNLDYENGLISKILSKDLSVYYDSALYEYSYDNNNRIIDVKSFVYQFGKESIKVELQYTGDSLMTRRYYDELGRFLKKKEWYYYDMKVYKEIYYAIYDTSLIGNQFDYSYDGYNLSEVVAQTDENQDGIFDKELQWIGKYSRYTEQLNPFYNMNFWQFDFNIEQYDLIFNKNIYQYLESYSFGSTGCQYLNPKFDKDKLVSIEGFGGCGKDSSVHWSTGGLLFKYY